MLFDASLAGKQEDNRGESKEQEQKAETKEEEISRKEE